jgi:sortase (surface protein transpeptidase)
LASAIGSQQLFPGESLLASFWSNPLSYESASYREQRLLQGFTEVDLSQGQALGSGNAATRLIVPSIDVDSRVTELAILDLGGSRAYETPDRTVGHIPETANAGESGSAWFFGHTESPLLGEGSVFFSLSKIPGKLQNGEDVFVVTENGEHRYLYRITSSRVVHQRDMRLYDTGQATIHLVSCVPRLVYDYRLIVSGELIGME